jgi:hypothetical protein
MAQLAACCQLRGWNPEEWRYTGGVNYHFNSISAKVALHLCRDSVTVRWTHIIHVRAFEHAVCGDAVWVDALSSPAEFIDGKRVARRA